MRADRGDLNGAFFTHSATPVLSTLGATPHRKSFSSSLYFEAGPINLFSKSKVNHFYEVLLWLIEIFRERRAQEKSNRKTLF